MTQYDAPPTSAAIAALSAVRVCAAGCVAQLGIVPVGAVAPTPLQSMARLVVSKPDHCGSARATLGSHTRIDRVESVIQRDWRMAILLKPRWSSKLRAVVPAESRAGRRALFAAS